MNRAQRLLVTNAHVADNRIQHGELLAVPHGTEYAMPYPWPRGNYYRVEHVWYHPYVGRDPAKRRPGEKIDPVAHPSNDVAILQLADHGPDLTEELALAGPETDALPAMPLGMLGFPSHASPRNGDPVLAAFSHGYVSRGRRFSEGAGSTRTKGPCDFFEHTVPTLPGQSGAPLFLADGRVIGVHSFVSKSPPVQEEDGSVVQSHVPNAVHVKGIWRCIQHYPILRQYFELR